MEFHTLVDMLKGNETVGGSVQDLLGRDIRCVSEVGISYLFLCLYYIVRKIKTHGQEECIHPANQTSGTPPSIVTLGSQAAASHVACLCAPSTQWLVVLSETP